MASSWVDFKMDAGLGDLGARNSGISGIVYFLDIVELLDCDTLGVKIRANLYNGTRKKEGISTVIPYPLEMDGVRILACLLC